VRTTLVVDDDVLNAARELAEHRSVSIGTVISELSRIGLQAGKRTPERHGRVPTFARRHDAPAITSDDVRSALEDE
jgi:hypothetical protein